MEKVFKGSEEGGGGRPAKIIQNSAPLPTKIQNLWVERWGGGGGGGNNSEFTPPPLKK